MSYFQLPSLPYNNNIKLSLNNNNSHDHEKIIINKTLVIYLKNIKSEIENFSNEWDNFKNILIHMNIFILLFQIPICLLVNINLYRVLL